MRVPAWPPARTRRMETMFRKVAFLAAMTAAAASAAPADDEKIVAQLDRDYQHAVKMNDAATIARIHADDMILVTGRGKVFSGKDIEERARKAVARYEKQEIGRASCRERV